MEADVLYFGYSYGRGHALLMETGRVMPADFPWQHHLDGGLCWNTERLIGRVRLPDAAQQQEGDGSLWHKAGWTALAWWDRTGDRRPNSNTAIFARGTYTAEQMLALYRARFPYHFRGQQVTLRHAEAL